MEAPIKRAQPCDPRVPAARAFRRWYTWVQAGAALAALAIGIAASTASYVLGTRVAVENARNAFHIVSFNLADVVRQSCYVPSVAFDALVAGLTPSTVRYDALAFREVAHNLMLLCPVVMDVETYRILPDADRDAWERRMSAARNHTIVVWGVTGTPSARLPEYIVTETSVIHADPVLFGLDVTPFLPPHADVIARARNDMQAGMFMMWDATTMQMLLMTLRPLIAPARLNSSVAVGPVDLSVRVTMLLVARASAPSLSSKHLCHTHTTHDPASSSAVHSLGCCACRRMCPACPKTPLLSSLQLRPSLRAHGPTLS